LHAGQWPGATKSKVARIEFRATLLAALIIVAVMHGAGALSLDFEDDLAKEPTACEQIVRSLHFLERKDFFDDRSKLALFDKL